MEIRILVVAIACLSCLVPPALGSMLVAKKALLGAAKGAVIGGIKGAAIGAGLGIAAKGAAALAAKKVLLGILLKGAALKGGAILAAKKAAAKGAGTLALEGLRGIMAVNRMVSGLAERSSESDCEPTMSRSPLLDILSGTARVVQSALQPSEISRQKARAVYRIISAPPRVIAVPF